MSEPVLVTALLALVAYLLSFVLVLSPARAEVELGAPDEQGRTTATFKLAAPPGTRSVHVAGDWNGWSGADEAWALSDPDGDGTFEGSFTLPAGSKAYKFGAV